MKERPLKGPAPKAEWHQPHKALFKPMSAAIHDFAMIRPGDKILVCLSGGKDSLSLLHALRQYQFASPFKFEFGAVTVDPRAAGYNPAALKVLSY